MPPLITHLYTADPSAHVFEDKVYIYPSHDRENGAEKNAQGDHYDMNDYHVFSTPSLDPLEPITDHGPVLKLDQIPWALRQLWAPDAAHANGQYYLYYPARSKADTAHQRFRIGVAVGPTPTGPFVADPEPIPGSFSIDPAVFVDDDGKAYMYFGGLWGGELQCYPRGDIAVEAVEEGHCFDPSQLGNCEPSGDSAALGPRVAQLTPDMRSFSSPAREALILAPETGQPIVAGDHSRRFFEAAWVHKRKGEYYFSYSTGDTHLICYARSKSPWGPFVYGGVMLEPVYGWTTHHSVVEFGGRWWLFYHDCEMSGGVSHLRCVKVVEILYDEDGGIVTQTPERDDRVSWQGI